MEQVRSAKGSKGPKKGGGGKGGGKIVKTKGF
jgi:hypothetical protein